APGTGQTHPPPGGVSSHVAVVATPRLKHEYDPDDKIKLRTSCDHCHVDQKLMPDGTKPSKKGLAEFDAETTEIQEEICGKIQEVQSRLDAISKPQPQQVPLLDQARLKLSAVVLDGSRGAHDKNTARRHIQQAQVMIDDACAISACPKPPSSPNPDPKACR